MRNLQILQPSNAKKMAKARCDLRFVARLSCPSFSGATHRVWATQQHNYFMAISMKGNICISYHFHILYIYIYMYVYIYICVCIFLISSNISNAAMGAPWSPWSTQSQSQSNHPKKPRHGSAARLLQLQQTAVHGFAELIQPDIIPWAHGSGGSPRLETPGEHQQLGWTWMFIPQIWYCYNHWM